MAGPVYLITAEETTEQSWNYDSAGIKNDRNPSWCVAFVRYKHAAVMYRGTDDYLAEKPILIVDNDCVSVQTNAPKAGFAKTCNLTMKMGKTYYANAVSPGDMCFVWLATQQDDIDGIVQALLSIAGIGGTGPFPHSAPTGLNDWFSGLKFFGRVMAVPTADSIQGGSGTRNLTQTVSCQAFVELASSVYYTFVAQNIITADTRLRADAANTNYYQKVVEGISTEPIVGTTTSSPTKGASNGLEVALTNLSKAFLGFYRRVDGKDAISGDSSPEAVIGMLFIITMGINADSLQVNHAIPNARGTFGDSIGIPHTAACILERMQYTKLWQCYNLYLGLQEYPSVNTNSQTPWVDFSPIFTPETTQPEVVFYRTPVRCKGFVPFLIPPIWENNSFWNIYSQFLNPVCNEMYTAMRCNRDGHILPTIVVREKPFSTNLFTYLSQGKAPKFTPVRDTGTQQSKGVNTIKQNMSTGDNDSLKAYGKNYTTLVAQNNEITKRTMYSNLPRWDIDESAIKSVNVTPSEANRINFVQVWGRSRGIEFAGLNINQEVLKQAQFQVPNYVSDDFDIKRHGLRADITETNFDVVSNNLGTISNILAMQRADWLFNGHLKLSGTIVLEGVQEPICEGDNCQVRGVLFHIENVSHNGQLGGDGKKTFTTTLTVSNGIIASTLDTNEVPSYAAGDDSFSTIDSMTEIADLPGVTDISNEGPEGNRDGNGEDQNTNQKNSNNSQGTGDGT